MPMRPHESLCSRWAGPLRRRASRLDRLPLVQGIRRPEDPPCQHLQIQIVAHSGGGLACPWQGGTQVCEASRMFLSVSPKSSSTSVSFSRWWSRQAHCDEFCAGTMGAWWLGHRQHEAPRSRTTSVAQRVSQRGFTDFGATPPPAHLSLVISVSTLRTHISCASRISTFYTFGIWISSVNSFHHAYRKSSN
jgi:hypothetical protein